VGVFRYETSCGTVYGHSGNTVGYTQYAVVTADGSRSAVVSLTLQRVVEAAICAAAD
jgi:D-alanyl-D-alanine carboxypeptidase